MTEPWYRLNPCPLPMTQLSKVSEPNENHVIADSRFEVRHSPGFLPWLAGAGGSIAFSTYQAGKLFLFGIRDDAQLCVCERTFERAMGIGVSHDSRSILLAAHYDIRRFDDVARGRRPSGDFDAHFAPHAAWVTGDLDAHDVGFGPDGRPIFVNTLFSCLATVSDDHSFKPLWRPKFVSSLAPEDRCHLNGLALEHGQPRYVSAVAKSDVPAGWREQRRNGGVIIDVRDGETIVGGLSMPHSPRLHADQLWILNSGTGEFGYIDRDQGAFRPVCFCPGYARGLSFAANFAIVGLSRARGDSTFQGLPLEKALGGRPAVCGLAVINMRSGTLDHWASISGIVNELYDVAFLPEIKRPHLIGLKGDEVRYVISIED